MEAFHSIGKSLDKGTETDIVYVDFAKAFDSVCHARLLAKLRSFGITSSSNLYFARVIPSIQTVLLSIGALEFKNLQYTFKNLLQPIYKIQGTFTNI